MICWNAAAAARLSVVKDRYTSAVTQVSNGVSYTRGIDILSGVKQGCPLGQFLFDLVMDELVERLNSSPNELSQSSTVSTWLSLMTLF